MRIGVDTGGTFTDCVVFRGSRIEIIKVFSGRKDAARNTIEGLRRLAGAHVREISDIIHGTTVGTNALLERTGARVALITTAGFEDLIEIGRQNRERLYDLNPQPTPPLIPRAMRWGIGERIASDGSVLARPRLAELRRLGERLRRSGAESVAVCLLFSFMNSAHEQAILRALRGCGLPLSISHQLLPEFREYERLATTVVNAYLAPRVGGYLSSLERGARGQLQRRPRQRGLGRTPRLFVMQSNGGIAASARAAREPVRTILSGPAGGIVATEWLAKLAGFGKVISFDMGGTSTDVCLLDGGARTTRETSFAGLPVAVPVLDIHSVGAGGGSLARLDAGGALRVGPESAGAAPGPACYGRGGTQPTITDSNAILGRLDPDHFLGGEFRLDIAAAARAFDDFLRRERKRVRGVWKSREELAADIVAVGNTAMEKVLRVISVERGFNPREFSLVSFGGGGGLHAAELAHSLGLARVIVPRNPGAFSAMGVLLSDIVRDASQSVLLPVPIRAATVRERTTGKTISRPTTLFFSQLEQHFAMLERTARAELRDDGFASDKARAKRSLDVRYRGQSYELAIPYGSRFAELFHREHERAYGYSDPARPLEIVNLRARLVVATPTPRVSRQRLAKNADARRAWIKTKPVWVDGKFVATPIYDRERLLPGHAIRGPAVVPEYSSTTVVPPDFECRVDPYLNLILTEISRSSRESPE